MKDFYNGVFERTFPSTGVFDSEKLRYTLFVNLSPDTNRASVLSDAMKTFIGADCYEQVYQGEIMDRYVSLMRTEYNISSVLFCDLTTGSLSRLFKDYSTAQSEILNLISGRHDDSITAIVVLPDNNAMDLLREFCRDLSSRTELIVFTAVSGKEVRLVESVCAAVMLRAMQGSEEGEFLSDLNRISAVADDYVRSLSDHKVQQEVTSVTDHTWSTFSCAFYNEKLDYVQRALKSLYMNADLLDIDKFKELASRIYTEMIKDPNVSGIYSQSAFNVLSNTMSLIPKIDNTSLKLENMSLDDYFDQVYGNRGREVVTLSLKITLMKSVFSSPSRLYENVSHVLVDSCAEYGCHDLLKELTSLISEYVDKIEAEYKKNLQALDHLCKDVPQVDDNILLAKFLHVYLVCEQIRTEAEFWKDISEYISANYSVFKISFERSRRISDEIMSRLKTMTQIPEITVNSSFKRSELIEPAENEAVCRAIRDAFDRSSETVEGNKFVRLCRTEETFSLNINTFISANKNISIASGAYSISGVLKYGKYLHEV